VAFVNRVMSGIRALVGKTRSERELDTELRHYFDAAVERNLSAGMSRADATRAARAEMGSIEAVKDEIPRTTSAARSRARVRSPRSSPSSRCCR
jgi:hypothetical protein